MSEKQEAIARRVIDEVWNNGNLKLIDELFTTDYVNNDPVNPVRGREGTRDLVKKYRTAFPDLRLHIDDLFSAGDRVVIRWHSTGTHRGQLEGLAPTGRQGGSPGITIFRLAGDQVREAFVNWDALGLMQQLGVVTLPGKSAKAGM